MVSSHPSFLEIADAATCGAQTPQVTEGPYWVDEKLNRSDIRTDPSTGVARQGTPLTLNVTVINSNSGSCVPLSGAWVDIWHCDAIGIYSDESTYNPGGGTGNVNTQGQKFLRGYQVTDDNGQVSFTTIYPGWYSGRTIHVHARIRTWKDSTDTTELGDFVTQFFFDDAINNVVLAQSPYNTRTSARDTTNATDNIYNGATNSSLMLAAVTQTSAGYAATITVDVSLLTPSVSAPSITAGGIANAASGAAGVAPASWISIYGTNLAATTRTMTSADLVENTMPTKLGGVSVQIDGQAAFVYYVSATQINVLSPADSNAAAVSVTVANSAGTSSAASATLQAIQPGLFVLSKYVRAVRPSDNIIVNGTGAAESGYSSSAAAKPGDVLELYGTGLGPTQTSVDAGLVFTGAYETTNPVTVTIGGIQAPVSWAGLVGPGLYQINVTVPTSLSDGDHEVVASVAGINSPSSVALLKTASS